MSRCGSSMDPKENNQTVTCTEPSGADPLTPIPAVPTKSLVSTISGFQKGAHSPGPEAPKILSRNCNGTVVLTSSPNNEAELQLYRVMQKASLLAYYDTLLEMGGDDVQQLCDAGEEEFLEIMALVGMASKPLHVRRLQKALQEWVTSPESSHECCARPPPPFTALNPNSSAVQRQENISGQAVILYERTPLTSDVSTTTGIVSHVNSVRPSNNTPSLAAAVPSNHSSPAYKEASPSLPPDQNQVANTETYGQKEGATTPRLSPNPVMGFQGPGSLLTHTPVLVDSQILRLAEVAETLVKTLPQFEPKPHNAKKKLCRDLENVMNMADDDPRRMDEIRKYAAIYGRFDCKRNPQKPLTLHEVSVNEAAAQICRFSPALLTRRDDLFALARQVVRDSGYHYTKHPSISSVSKLNLPSHHLGSKNSEETHNSKRAKTDTAPSLSPVCGGGDPDRIKRQERLEQIAEELRLLGDKTEELVQAAQQVRQTNDLSAIQNLQHQMETVQNKQTQLLLEQSDLLRQPLPPRIYRRNHSRLLSSQLESEKHDTDDTDSQFSLSNASSPSQEVGDSRDSLLRDGEAFGNNGPPTVKSPGKLNKQYILDVLSEEEFRNRKSEFYIQDKIQVISASGGNIIAVANPALSMSSVLLKTKDIHSSTGDSCLSVKVENED